MTETSQTSTTEAAPELHAILDFVRRTPAVILTSHARPDGDAVGSVLALAAILDQLGCTSEVLLADPVPHIYRTLPSVSRIRHVPPAPSSHPAILLECDSIERSGLSGLEGRFLVNLDHHASGRPFANLNWIDDRACAVAAMVYRLAVAAGADLTPAIATCLYAAVLSDTGSFTYSGTTSETFALARDLTLRGADPVQIARDIYFSNPESKIRLLGAALSNLHREGPIAWTWVTTADMHLADARPEDCEGVVNYLVGIAGVEAAVFLRELPEPRQFRLSLRSKGKVDVAAIAEHFGGGGHRTASGGTIHDSLEAATTRILTQLRAVLC